ncbi:tetratricopeptide repeat protein [Tateyamaria sp.]|uniref:tetratricopeptide repeat protein n=1 Tax=Tateyamaria sp. TaxID=1929288 RepID=UPI00329BFABB
MPPPASNHFDDLPQRPSSHVTEEKALSAFQQLLADSNVFILQSIDRKDYGTDCQIEAIVHGNATNVRLHVQVKGTEKKINSDGSISVEIDRPNLNYLLTQPYSFFVCFHVPTEQLRIKYAEEVLREYEHEGKNWTTQRTLTVSFSSPLSVAKLETLRDLAKTQSDQFRDYRNQQISNEAPQIAENVRSAVPLIHVPEDQVIATKILAELYDRGADEVISLAFEKFEAVLGADSRAFGPSYMAEINLGMASDSNFPERIASAIEYFERKISDENYLTGSIHYSIGNAHSAMGNETLAKESYEKALEDHRLEIDPFLAAQAHKNLGTSFERLGHPNVAVEHYLKAIELLPNLPEAHNALGNHYLREGRYEEALEHFDQIIFGPHQQNRMAAVSGWRVNVLFNLDQGRAAFREINTLLVDGQSAPWILPWCARQVANFGRTSIKNARLALAFWERLFVEEPDVSVVRRELLLTRFYLRSCNQNINMSFEAFCVDFALHVSKVTDSDDAALLWDRLGHWAQDNENWIEAEKCFRRAFDLAGGHYGYCLGTALNFLERFDESLPILEEQAETIQPDAMSWFQLARSHGSLKNTQEAIAAYKKAISLDPDYDLAMFNLGGIYWNCGRIDDAKCIWDEARTKFPDHELTKKLDRDLPFLFANS